MTDPTPAEERAGAPGADRPAEPTAPDNHDAADPYAQAAPGPHAQPNPGPHAQNDPGLDDPGLDGPGLDGPGLDSPGQDGLGLDGLGLDGPGQDGPGPDGRAERHALLLRLAGRLPDELLTTARGWLAAGRTDELSRALTFAVLSAQLPMTGADILALAALVIEEGGDPATLSAVPVGEADAVVPWVFAAFDPATADAAEVVADPVDAAAVEFVAGIDGVRGLWRAWRLPALPTPWPPPRRVHVLETAPGADTASVGARLQVALAAAGEPHPQVEAYPSGAALPAYQRLARAEGALLWAAEPAQDVRIARVFDAVDPQDGPSFAPEHPVVTDEDEFQLLLDRLEAGVPLLTTTAVAEDVVEPARGAVVPLSFRTDGTWIWTEASTYYLQRYALAPDPDLHAHLLAAPDVPAPDGVALHRAAEALLRADEEATDEPVWVVPAG